jgi:site-specific DNA recombinase
VRRVKDALERQGVKSKTRMGRDGKPFGGAAFSRGALNTLLRNRLYIGEVSHRGKAYPGEHPAVVPRELWERVQTTLESNRVERRNGTHAKNPSLLAGILFDEHGHRMTPSHAAKHGKRYRYYFSQGLLADPEAKPNPASRVPAHELEQRVVERISVFLGTPQEISDGLALPDDDSRSRAALISAAERHRAQLAIATPAVLRPLILRIISKITLSEQALQINVLKGALRRWLLQPDKAGETKVAQEEDRDAENPSFIVLTADIALRRWSGAAHLVLPHGSAPAPQLNAGLIRAVVCARMWHAELLSGKGKSQPRIAQQLGISERYLRKVIPCAFLAPDIVEAILRGRQPAELTLAKLTHRLPNKWSDQRTVLAFASN